MSQQDLTPEEWLEEITRGLEYRSRFGLEDMWGWIEAAYYNVHESMMNDGPNILLSQGDAMLSMLSVPSPRVMVSPRTPEGTEKAPLVEALDNALLDELQLVEEAETTLLHAYLFGRGIVKIGYDSEWGYDPTLDIGGNQKLGLTLSQLNRKGDRQIEYNSLVQPGMPWVRAVMPHDIVVPWGVRDLETTPWIAHRVVRHIEDLKADKKYENTARLEPQLSMRDFVESYRSRIKPFRRANTDKADHIEFYEIMERRTGKVLAVTWDSGKFLRKEDNLLQIQNRLPYASVSFTPKTRAFWTTPDAYYLSHVQTELSDVARQRTKQRRIAGLKFLYDGDSITEEELAKILSPDVGVAAKVESGRDITKAIIKMETQPNQLLIQEEETLRANAREQIGFSRNQLGEYQSGRKTATEVMTVDRSSQLRMSRRGLVAKRLYEDVIKTVNNIVFKHWTVGRYVRVMGENQAETWARINGPALDAQYNYRVEFADEQEIESRKMHALQLYGMLSQDPTVDKLELTKFLVAQVNDPSFGKLFNADIQSQMQQQQVQGAQQGGGGVQQSGAGGGKSPLAQLPQLLRPPDQGSISPAARLLAGGRNHP